MTPRVLIAGIGNIFLGDDGFGVEVARRLSAEVFPGRVRVADYGIRGMHLAYDLVSGEYDLTVMVDATQRGDAPGTVYVVELDPPDGPPRPTAEALDAHGMQPDVVLNLVALLGGNPGRVLLVGCEPAVLDHRMELSPPVVAAVDTAVGAVADIIGACQSPDQTVTIGRNRVPVCALVSPAR
ncbi:hydrogenase maturation protease [Amycolatopsis orientalis]|uniref:hydrogenase maturation protease n=1 Tax=Amycolatopsis orientalis TaxID=31958 RepID=UPI0003FED6F4|nr:hydrogenase maturation protease [Amycolatopsis orientalis]